MGNIKTFMTYLSIGAVMILLAGCSINSSESVQNSNTPVHHDSHHEHMEMMHKVDSEYEFILEMIPHHQEAVESSEKMLEYGTSNEELHQLLEDIVVAQENEIEMMETWLMEWYEEKDHDASYMKMMPNLSNYEGVDRDRAYIESMIHHHEMAVVMAKSVLEIESIRDEVRELAEEIIEVQNEEIELMRNILESY